MTSTAPIIGVTGGIASGKSTVADMFAELGIPWVDADIVARDIVAPGEPALDEIVARYGNSLLDTHGELQRRALRDIVFADDSERQWLESVTHPRIRQRLRERLEAIRQGAAPYGLLVSPLLFETDQVSLVDRRLVIDVPETLQVTRTQARDEVSETQAHAILAAQMPRQERLALADDVIENHGDMTALKAQVAELDARYRQLFDGTHQEHSL
ncbi:dephospho-CoA kinase [Chromohalobacter canadensis]|uniref:dephospho-CoA kinase n=1 Tax=Chromohalobacter canadensis TaxID=141389 RepID=UPI0021BEA690|nr:dephospho-CoA kinase [Chromohalobacter canadensis]MCT8469551.1 dephospho-CoA kinase [Chromohalobacter canadensis]MCT8472175.1 dephospho-CoA kinase [Chromohalobacter canadensis]MCT8499713.1 dephospho-CoA kinase [Chromohalobacter canadensis]